MSFSLRDSGARAEAESSPMRSIPSRLKAIAYRSTFQIIQHHFTKGEEMQGPGSSHSRTAILWAVALIAMYALLCGVLAVNCPGAEVTNTVGPHLQAVSVNVLAGRSQGSGTIFLVKVEGKEAAFIVTANHVIDGLREVSSVIGADGDTKKVIRYGDAQVIQEQVQAGRTVGEVKYDAKIINIDTRRDIALLRVRKGDFAKVSAVFYLGGIPVVGTEIYHCGAPGGKETGGTCTLTGGIISRVGVRIPGFGGGSEHGVFDQTDTAALGGSSGGLLALKDDGRFIGMITLGLGGGNDSFHWYVPARSIYSWSKEIGVEWLFNPGLKRPTEEDVKGIILEHLAPNYASEN